MIFKTKKVFKVAQKVWPKFKCENEVKNKLQFVIWHTKLLEGGQQLNYISRKNYLQKIKKRENRLRKDDETSKDGDASTVELNRSVLQKKFI